MIPPSAGPIELISKEKRILTSIEKMEKCLAPFRDELVNHRIYGEIDRLEALQLFMEQHVFAVWDFMSLLKMLQRRICCVEVPWLSPVDAPQLMDRHAVSLTRSCLPKNPMAIAKTDSIVILTSITVR